MKKNCKFFTLVEVLLALGVCAIGVCSIMVLFPVGASASRDAAAQTYVANMADELLHFLQYEYTRPGAGALPVCGSCPDAPVLTLEDLKISPTAWTQLSVFNQNIYIKGSSPASLSDGILQMVGKRGSGASEQTDFRCMGQIWGTPIILGSGGTEYGKEFHLIISWPLEIPYDQRQKSEFVLKAFKL